MPILIDVPEGMPKLIMTFFPNRSLSPKATEIQVAENSNLSRNFVNQQITYKTRSKPHLTKPPSNAMSKARTLVELDNRSSKERGTKNLIPVRAINLTYT